MQVLMGVDATEELVTLCGFQRLPPYEARYMGYPNPYDYYTQQPPQKEALVGERRGGAVAEWKMRRVLFAALRNVLAGHAVEYPDWERPDWGNDDLISPRGICPDCASRIQIDIVGAVYVAIDQMLERGVMPPSLAPFTRGPGESPTELLLEFLRELGPQPKHMLERFVWARAHPDDVDEQETVGYGAHVNYLHMERASVGMWATNWGGMIRRGTLIRIDSEGERPLYAAPSVRPPRRPSRTWRR
jgi:hypothetical protein